MEGDNPAARREQAERAIERADGNISQRNWVYAARHKVMTRCDDQPAAAKLLDEYRARNLSSGLNNDAWYLMVQPQSMGRYDSMALALCEEMMRVEQGLDFGSMDTIALAYFCNGHLDKAIKMQTDACQQGGNQATYVARLKRYQATKAALADGKAKRAPQDTKK